MRTDVIDAFSSLLLVCPAGWKPGADTVSFIRQSFLL